MCVCVCVCVCVRAPMYVFVEEVEKALLVSRNTAANKYCIHLKCSVLSKYQGINILDNAYACLRVQMETIWACHQSKDSFCCANHSDIADAQTEALLAKLELLSPLFTV